MPVNPEAQEFRKCCAHHQYENSKKRRSTKCCAHQHFPNMANPVMLRTPSFCESSKKRRSTKCCAHQHFPNMMNPEMLHTPSFCESNKSEGQRKAAHCTPTLPEHGEPGNAAHTNTFSIIKKAKLQNMLCTPRLPHSRVCFYYKHV